MSLDSEQFVVASDFEGVLGIVQSARKISNLAVDGGKAQITGSGRVVRELIGFVISLESEIVFTLGLVEIALREGLRDGIGGLRVVRNRESEKQKQKEKSSPKHGTPSAVTLMLWAGLYHW
jgi:hypothetical protein